MSQTTRMEHICGSKELDASAIPAPKAFYSQAFVMENSASPINPLSPGGLFMVQKMPITFPIPVL